MIFVKNPKLGKAKKSWPRAETLDALPKDLDGYRVHPEVIGPIKAR